MAVTLINVFSVPKGKEDEFTRVWEDIKRDITKQPGFIGGKFTRALSRIVDSISSMLRCGKTRRAIGKPLKRAQHP